MIPSAVGGYRAIRRGSSAVVWREGPTRQPDLVTNNLGWITGLFLCRKFPLFRLRLRSLPLFRFSTQQALTYTHMSMGTQSTTSIRSDLFRAEPLRPVRLARIQTQVIQMDLVAACKMPRTMERQATIRDKTSSSET